MPTLPAGFTLPIAAGTYTMSLNEGTGTCVTIADSYYEFDIAPFAKTGMPLGTDASAPATYVSADFMVGCTP